MGKVLVTAKLFPEGPEVDLEKIKKEVKEKINPEKIEEEPIAFGLVSLKIEKVIEDDGKSLEELEEKLKSISNVSQAEIVQVSRVFF